MVPGHFFRQSINSVELVDSDGRTVGLLFYSFHAARAALNHTGVEWA